MRIEDSSGKEISSMEDWAKIYASPQKSVHWKKGRSAYSLAEFILNRDGSKRLSERIEQAIGQKVELSKAIPEYKVCFDQYGKGRVHDLAVWGQTVNGKSVFIGVEAKVDEPFGDLVKNEYLKAKAKQIITEDPTKLPERIERLLRLHFSEAKPEIFDVRYQLLYATAGTLAEPADIHILFVVVFKTSRYNKTKGAENYQDYVHFMDSVGARRISLPTEEALAHRLVLDGKPLICLYEYFVYMLVISSHPEVMNGALVFAGTRVPVEISVHHLAAGDSLDQFLDDFPTVSREQVIAYLNMTLETMYACVA